MNTSRIAYAIALLALACLTPATYGRADERVGPESAGVSPSPRPSSSTRSPSMAQLAAAVDSVGLGAVSGIVTDTLGAPVQYVIVLAQGLPRGAYTSADGKYTIARMPPGRYTLIARFAGYAPATSQVRVERGATAVADFKLIPRPRPTWRPPGSRPGDAAILADPDVRTLARDASRFAVDLYRQLAPAHGNLFFSPWSIRTVLGMAYSGARGATKQQMAAALRDSVRPWRIHAATSRLDSLLRAPGAGAGPTDVVMDIARAAWVARDLHLEVGFADTLRLRYAAPPAAVDFAQGEQARAKINRWVVERTHGRIRDLIPPRGLDRFTRLVLCDAIYFWGAWQDSFPSSQTSAASFRPSDRDTMSVPFMHYTHIRRYMENRDLQMLEVPYRGGDLAMLVVLPKAVDGLPALERQLDPDSLNGWIARTENAVVQLTLPKFRVEGGFKLARQLSAMGMPDAFREGADFSGIARERPLFISEVYHKAFVTVDEYGTEAAAGTAAGMTLGAIRVPERQVIFTADHPFLFLIRHRPSGTILFMGRLADPR